mgnify:CR=1 FL=1
MDKESMEMFQKILDRLDKMDNRLDKMDNRFDVLEVKQDRTGKKLDDLQVDFVIAERRIRHDIHELKDEMETVIEVLKMNEMVPR